LYVTIKQKGGVCVNVFEFPPGFMDQMQQFMTVASVIAGVLAVVGIYYFILKIILAHRGIKALGLYIRDKRQQKAQG
jgi:hypothetical protein